MLDLVGLDLGVLDPGVHVLHENLGGIAGRRIYGILGSRLLTRLSFPSIAGWCLHGPREDSKRLLAFLVESIPQREQWNRHPHNLILSG